MVVCRFGQGTTAGPVGATAAAAGADKVSNPNKAATAQQPQQPAVLSRGPAAGAAGRLDSWDLDDAGLPDSSPSTLPQGKVQDLLCGHSGAARLAVSCMYVSVVCRHWSLSYMFVLTVLVAEHAQRWHAMLLPGFLSAQDQLWVAEQQQLAAPQ